MSVTTLTLVRHHDAYRRLNKWTPLALVAGTAWLGVVTRLAGANGQANPWVLLGTMWFVPALHLVAGGSDKRCREVLLTLPLSGRRLWLAGVLAHAAASGLVLLVTLGTAWAGLAWLGHLGVGDGIGIAALRAHLGPVALQIASWWVLLLVSLQARRPGLVELTHGRVYTLVTGVALVVGGFAVTNLGRYGPATALAPLVITAVVGGLAWRRVPPALSLAPRKPRAAGRARPASSAVRRSPSVPWLLPLTVLRATAKNQALPILTLPLLTGLGFMLGDNASTFTDSEYDSFLLVAITAYSIFAVTAACLPRLWSFDHLPISRGKILATLLVPQALCLAVGFGAGRILVAALGVTREPVAFDERSECYGVRLSPRFFAVAWDGRVPPAVSPAGESHTPHARRVLAGLPLALYKPYETPEGSSVDFVAWQLARATTSTFGQTIVADELRARYLTTDDAGRVVLKGEALTLAADHPSWRVAPARGVLALQILLVGLLAFTGLAIYLRCLRADVRPGLRKAAFGLILTALMILHLGPYLQSALLDIEAEVGAAFLVILAGRIADALPGGVVTFWVLVVAALAAAVRGVASVMARMELAARSDLG